MTDPDDPRTDDAAEPVDLAARRRVVPDEVTVTLPRGARALVVADLRLAPGGSDVSREVARSVARAVEELRGPAVLVCNGDTFDLRDGRVDIEGALAAHPRLLAALASFTSGPEHRLVVLPGTSDGALAWDPRAIEAVGAVRGELALACLLEIDTGEGLRRVRVEPGHRLDASAAFADPRDPNDHPLAQHLEREVLPTLAADAAWLSGIEDVVEPAELGALVASRFAYRRLFRRAAWLTVPVLAVLALFLPVVVLASRSDDAPAGWAILGRILAGGFALELVLVGAALAFSLAQLRSALASIAWWGRPERGNDDARGEAVRLASVDDASLVTAHTRRPELTDLGRGAFYANCGPAGRVVERVCARAGLPAVYAPRVRCSWVELEAGAGLHARLWHGVRALPETSLLERWAQRDRLEVVWPPAPAAEHPGTVTWPVSGDLTAVRRRTRRAAALAIGAAGVVNLGSALTFPLRSRLHALRHFVPLAVPQAAAAVVALAGLGLILLARGVRRGQRHAWMTAMALLILSVGGHVVKGLDVEEAVIALVVAGYLAVHTSEFGAPANPTSARRALVAFCTGLGVAITAGVAGVELKGPRIPIGRAVHAVAFRLVGVRDVKLPHGIDRMLSPALLATGVGLALWVGWLAFRPAVRPRITSFRPVSRERARFLVERYGLDSLSYFALRDDKEWFGYRDTMVAYRVHNGVALVSPDPIGPVAQRAEAWAAFRELADDHGWPVAVMGACADWLPVYRQSGMHDLYIGDEAVVDVRRFSLEGKQNKSLRQSVGRVRKAGYRVELFDPSRLDPALETRLRELMIESRRGEVERGFSMTLGRAFDPEDRGLLLAVAFDPSDAPAAFCQYVPARAIGGWSLDLMRRSECVDHPNGLTELVVVETIEHLRREGFVGLALNFATFRAVLASEAGAKLVHRVEKWFLERMSDSMQIESLWTFNEKFQPDWHPRYACYDAPEHMLSASIAVARAESFFELPVIGRFFVPKAPPAQDAPPRLPASPEPDVTDEPAPAGPTHKPTSA